MMRQLTMALLLVMLMMVGTAWGHGMMIDPPQRSSLWRFPQFSDSPKNYDDNQLFCGGFQKQYEKNGGKCGICGDDYNASSPRPNEAGGTYGRGIIAKAYQQGQVVNVKVKITANHLGYFLFKLCPNNDVTREVTQDCLDNHVLRVIDNGKDVGERFYIDSEIGVKQVKLQLPSDITCSQCVLQWKYNTGNSWGCNPDRCCLGCGNQENFINCADIAIMSSTSIPSIEKPKDTSATLPSTTQSSTTHTVTTAQQTTGTPHPTTTQTENMSTTTKSSTQVGVCRAIGLWASVHGMMEWCEINCARNNCPESHCACS